MDILNALKTMPRNNKHLLKPCSQCGCMDFEVRYFINKDGKDCYPYFCTNCDNRSPIVESKVNAKKLGFI